MPMASEPSHAQRIVDGGESAVQVDKSVFGAGGVVVFSDNGALVVDAERN